MLRVVVIGGGISGCAAAETALKAGAAVTLIERTDLLLGAARLAGYINQGGRFCLSTEAVAMGGGEILRALESLNLTAVGKGRARPLAPKAVSEGVKGYSLDLVRLEPTIRQLMTQMGVEVRLWSRAIDVKRVGTRLAAVKLAGGEWLEGDAFVDCTGTAGGLGNCIRYGKGCVMCSIYRCPTFGDRVSIAAKAGVRELMRRRPGGTPGVLYHTMLLYKDTLSPDLQEALRKQKRASVPIKDVVDPSGYAASFYAYRVYQGCNPETGSPFDSETAIGDPFDMGEMRLGSSEFPGMASCPNVPYLSYDSLRRIPGLENVIAAFPQGGQSSVVMGLALTPREDSLRVAGLGNVFVAGEKMGAIGVIECLVSGLLAGHNAVKAALGKTPVTLPRTTATGDYISFLGETMQTEGGLSGFHGAAAGVFLSRLIAHNLLSGDVAKIRSNVEEEGLANIYAARLTQPTKQG